MSLKEGNGTDPEKGNLDELAREIRRTIEENRKFLEKVMDDDFEPDDEPDDGECPAEEL